jgi:FkbM family methyltransferase
MLKKKLLLITLLLTSYFFPCHAQGLSNFPFERIHSNNSNEIVQYIQQFPFKKYKVYSVANWGSFYVDVPNDTIKNHIRYGWIWEPYIVSLIEKYAQSGTIMLDIGAHIGTHTLTMAQLAGPSGRVLAFEPQPKIFRELFYNMHLNGVNNVDFFWAGVGDHMGEIELSPFMMFNEGGTGLYGGTGKFVELLTIDSLNLENISLIKMDVEGQEDQVLAGARETILRCKPVMLIEIMGGHVFETASTEIRERILHTMQIVESMGYSLERVHQHDYLAVPVD